MQIGGHVDRIAAARGNDVDVAARDRLIAHDPAAIRDPFAVAGIARGCHRQIGMVNFLRRTGARRDRVEIGNPQVVSAGPGGGLGVAALIAQLAGVEYVVITAGRFDLLVEVVCTDTLHLLDVVNDRIRAIPDVSATEVFTYLSLVKQTYSWGVR